MTSTVHSPFVLFRFAVRERDWALAALLARALSNTERGRRRLERELERAGPPGEEQLSLFGLRVLARLLRAFRDGETPG